MRSRIRLEWLIVCVISSKRNLTFWFAAIWTEKTVRQWHSSIVVLE
jgi:hypothetical protein